MLTSLSLRDVVPRVGVLGQAQPAGHLVAARGMPGDHVRQLEHARAREAGEAQDLALVDVEVDAAQPFAGDIAHLEHDRRVRLRRARRTVVGIDVLADHETRERARGSRVAMSCVPTSRPPRRIVTRSASSKISSIRCET